MPAASSTCATARWNVKPPIEPRRAAVAALAAGALACTAEAPGPFLTGVVDDGESQVIEMPRLAGAWQRRIAWLAPEGVAVRAGDLLVRLDPGDLVVNAETAQADLERLRVEAERERAETALAVLDARKALAEAESEVRLAGFDAALPAGANRRLDYENAQLRFDTAENAAQRAERALTDAKARRTSALALAAMRIATAKRHSERLRTDIAATEIRADRDGLFIHSENRFTGAKVFVGATLQPTADIAKVASGEALRFRFWIHEADLRAVAPGARLAVVADAMPERRLAARVEWISTQAATRDEWSPGGYFELVATPEDTLPASLIPGMAVFAEVTP